jgi:cell division septal protein FtsQ
MNLFNHHKLKRQWGRGMIRHNQKNLHDFAWHQRKQNPLWEEAETNWRRRLELIVLGALSLAILGLIIFHPFFYINKIEISGLQRISRADLNDTITATINYHHWFLFPGQNYFLVNLSEVVQVVKRKFPIQTITVSKEFPNILKVILEEKITNIIYDNGQQYSYVGTDGKVLSLLRKVGNDEFREVNTVVPIVTITTSSTTSTEKLVERRHTPPSKSLVVEMGDYPIVYDLHQTVNSVNNQVLPENIVKGVIEWFNNIKKFTNIPFAYVLISNDLGEGEIYTAEGWVLKVRLNEQINSQFTELQYLIKNKVQRNNLKYIDLRYSGKVYWQ